MNKVLSFFAIDAVDSSGTMQKVYYETAYTPQEAVDKVRSYIPEGWRVDTVYKEIKRWK